MMQERRMAVSELEVRESSSHLALSGYASTFNEPYSMGWYEERVHPKAFNRTLGRNPDVRLLINHTGLPLARTASGTLTLDTDARGLRPYAELDLSDPDVQALAPKIRRGDVNAMSFSFRVDGADGQAWSDDMSERELRQLDLNDGDVSVVTYPANPRTVAALRSGGGIHVESLSAALVALETRGASTEEVVSVLTRALGYFTSIDTIVDAAQEEIADALAIPNPDDDEDELEDDAEDQDELEAQDASRAAALARLELRKRTLRIAG